MGKSRAPRKKQLKLVDHSPIGLTNEQQKQLRALYRPLSGESTTSLPAPGSEAFRRLSLGRLLFLYIETLCYDAGVENSKPRRKPITSTRRSVVKSLNKLCGRELAPDDIIKQLATYAPVPRFAADAIRRDYLRMSV